MDPRAKIVATVGPSTGDARSVKRLLKAGADVLRVNLSHGSAEEHRDTVARARSVSAELGLHVPVILDLMGPRYRLGRLEEPHTLRKGQRLVIGAAAGKATGKATERAGVDLPLDDLDLLEHLAPGDRFLIGDGLVELKVIEETDLRFVARVVNGGRVSSRKGINLPDTDIPFAISGKDRADIKLAVELDIDYIAASYVGTADDLAALRRLMRKAGGEIPLIAKLERARAIEHLDEIVASADAVMVARGDLGVEVPLHRVPVLQKRIIESGRLHAKPVIVATQMLESMMANPRPTRAESSDVANAVFDGADALMLSGETAAGRYPIEAVKTMCRIIREAETYRSSSRPRDRKVEPMAHANLPRDSSALADVVSAAAVFSTENIKVRQIVAFSQGGFTARAIARYRPETPICVLTTEPRVARRVQLVWGVRPLMLEAAVEHHDEVVDRVEKVLLGARLVRKGDTIVVLMGVPIRDRPLTNLMRLHQVRSDL